MKQETSKRKYLCLSVFLRDICSICIIIINEYNFINVHIISSKKKWSQQMYKCVVTKKELTWLYCLVQICNVVFSNMSTTKPQHNLRSSHPQMLSIKISINYPKTSCEETEDKILCASLSRINFRSRKISSFKIIFDQWPNSLYECPIRSTSLTLKVAIHLDNFN